MRVVGQVQFLLEDVQQAISSLLMSSMVEVEVDVGNRVVRDYERYVALDDDDVAMVSCDLTSCFR